MEEAARVTRRTVEGVFHDFKGRRAGLIKALTSDAEKFFQLCDPEKENLCLFGLPNETWEVNPPMDLVPPDVPEPALGINFARDGMNKWDWLLMIAAQCDSWLLAVAFCFCGLFDFEKNERKKLFQMINELQTIYEVVKGNAKSSSKVGESEEDDDFSGVLCGVCDTNDDPDEFWICCDVCEIWFHGMCVKTTPAKAEHLKEFKCPDCTSKRAKLQ